MGKTIIVGITYLLKCYCSNCLEIWVYCKMLSNLIKIFNFLLWEPKMCRLTWQLLGMLGNVLGLLGMFRNVLGMYRSLVVHYSLGFTAYKVASGGVYLRCGTPRTLRKGMPRRPRTLQACLGRCEACRGGRGRCQACLGVAKQAYTS